MLQFFLATFGEGMTDLYLRPYNEKIWKFDPAFMDMQMVERIPKPPAEDILRRPRAKPPRVICTNFSSATRNKVESSAVPRFPAFARRQGDGPRQRPGATAAAARSALCVVLTADGTECEFDRVVSTIPIPDLAVCLEPAPPAAVADAVARLKVNSIAICCLQVEQDRLADNFAVMVADRDVLFHRVSKLNFLLPEDPHGGPSVLMAEVTYQPGIALSRLTDDELLRRIGDDLARLGFIRSPGDVTAREVLRQRWAYVIYDLDHRRNVDAVRDYCEKQLGLILHGRFGEFEYLNMDAVVERSLQRSKEFIASGR